MITKQCQFVGRDEGGEYIHILRAGYENDHLVKTAAASPVQLAQIQSFMKDKPRSDNKLFTLVSALGAGEYWGSNSNADWFGEEALLHTPPGWDRMPYDQQRLAGARWEWGYPTFYNARAFAHHQNKNPNRAFGDIEYVMWDPHMKRVLLVVSFDRMRARQFGAVGVLDRVENGEFPSVSMGCRVPFDACFPAGTLIQTPNGYRPIEELDVGDRVISHRGRDQRVTRTFVRKADGLVGIKSVGVPRRIECTPNHPILILRRDEVRGCTGVKERRHTPDENGYCKHCGEHLAFDPEWVDAEDVKPGDYTLFPASGRGNPRTEVGVTYARVVGYYLGSGWVIRQRRGEHKDGDYKIMGLAFSIGAHEEDHADRLMATLLEHKTANEPNVYCDRENAVQVRVSDQALGVNLDETCGSGSRNKHLPAGFETWAREERLHLLGALIDTDGSQDHGVQKDSVRFTTTSEQLGWGVRALCVSLGITASLSSRSSVSGYGQKAMEAFTILIPASFSSLLAPYSEKVRAYDRTVGSQLFFWNGFLCAPVRCVESLPCGESGREVFNISVEEDESYVANGWAVHNCSICCDLDSIRHLFAFPQRIVAMHKQRPIRGLSTTTDQYCDHLRNELNKIYPDGRKTSMLNIHPRFFDLSVVFIGADKTSFILAKLGSECPIQPGRKACANCTHTECVPSAHVHEVWSRGPKKAAMEKTAKETIRVLSPNAVERLSGKLQTAGNVISTAGGGSAGAVLGTVLGHAARQAASPAGIHSLAGPMARAAPAIGGVGGALLGGALGYRQYQKAVGGGRSKKYERAQANKVIRMAKQQGYNVELVDKRSDAEFDKVRAVLRKQPLADQKAAGVAAPWAKKKKAESASRRGSVAVSLQKARKKRRGKEKTSAIPKDAEITKQITLNFRRSLPKITAGEPDISNDVLDQMSKDPENSLRTAGSMGIVLKPREFQRMRILSLGRPELADELDQRGTCFGTGAPPSDFRLGDSMVPRILRALLPMMMDRSALTPSLGKRTIIMIKTGSVPTVLPQNTLDHPFLEKISSDYSAYRRDLIYKAPGLIRETIYAQPKVAAELFGDDIHDPGLVKAGSDVMKSMVGMLSSLYLNEAYLEEPVSGFVREHCDLAGLERASGLAMLGGVA